MLKINKDQKRLPIGGHQFHENGFTFRGETFEEVVGKLREFRLFNHIPVGDPEQEILLYYVRNWPYMVKQDWDRFSSDPLDSDYVRWREWISMAWKNAPKAIVTVKQAKERWTICEKCPFNRKFGKGLADETNKLRQRAFLLRHGIQVPDYLGFCALHGADLSVFTMLDSPEKYSQKDAQAAGECWCSLEGPK